MNTRNPRHRPSLPRIVAASLVAIAASLAGAAAGEPSAEGPKPSNTPGPAEHGVVAYYFHGNVRCKTCRRIEALADEAIHAQLATELRSGKLQWRVVNVEEPGNEHFVQDFQLVTRSLVLVDLRKGKQTRYKVLDKVWKLVGDEEAFRRYVVDETLGYLGEEKG